MLFFRFVLLNILFQSMDWDVRFDGANDFSIEGNVKSG